MAQPVCEPHAGVGFISRRGPRRRQAVVAAPGPPHCVNVPNHMFRVGAWRWTDQRHVADMPVFQRLGDP